MDFIIGYNHKLSPRTEKNWYILLAKHKICIWIIKKLIFCHLGTYSLFWKILNND